MYALASRYKNIISYKNTPPAAPLLSVANQFARPSSPEPRDRRHSLHLSGYGGGGDDDPHAACFRPWLLFFSTSSCFSFFLGSVSRLAHRYAYVFDPDERAPQQLLNNLGFIRGRKCRMYLTRKQSYGFTK